MKAGEANSRRGSRNCRRRIEPGFLSFNNSGNQRETLYPSYSDSSHLLVIKSVVQSSRKIITLSRSLYYIKPETNKQTRMAPLAVRPVSNLPLQYHGHRNTIFNMTRTQNDTTKEDGEEDWTQEQFLYNVAENGTLEGVEVFKYKKVANKIKPVPATLPEEYRIVRRMPHDPLWDLPTLPTKPSEFVSGHRYTQECYNLNPVNSDLFLIEEETKLVHYMFKAHENGFA